MSAPTVRWHVVGTFRTGLNGDTVSTRPAVVDGGVAEAEGRGEAMRARIGVHYPEAEAIEVTVHEVTYDVYFDERRREDVKRETGRAPLGVLTEHGWNYPDGRPLKPARVTAWKAVIQDDMRSLGTAPPIPPEAVRRAGPDAVREWYGERLAAADARHAERLAAMRAIAEDGEL